MPWFPDFVSAVELARRQTRMTGPGGSCQRVLQCPAVRRDPRTRDSLAGRGGDLRPSGRGGPWPPPAAGASSATINPSGRSTTPPSRRSLRRVSAGERSWSCWSTCAISRAGKWHGRSLSWPSLRTICPLCSGRTAASGQWTGVVISGRRYSRAAMRTPAMSSVVFLAAMEAGDSRGHREHLRARRISPGAHRPTSDAPWHV